MTTFERKYTADEKEAAIHAAIDRRIKPQKAVVLMAARGELVTKDGRQVRPFELNPYTLRSWVNIARRKRNGRIPGAAYENPEGTIEALRKRLIALADGELAYLERQRTGKRDPEHMRQIARAVREAAAIPVNGQPRSRAPGNRDEKGEMPDGATNGGMAGSLLRAHRAKPAPGPPSPKQTQTENADMRATGAQTQETEAEPRGIGSLNSDSASQQPSTASV